MYTTIVSITIPGHAVNVYCASVIQDLTWIFLASGHIIHTGLDVHWQPRCHDAGEEHTHLETRQMGNNRIYDVLNRSSATLSAPARRHGLRISPGDDRL